MALINCPECSKEVSDNVQTCPHCGLSFKKANKEKAKAEKKQKEINPKKKKNIKIAIITIVVILLSTGGFLGYEARLQALPTMSAISSIGEVTSNSESPIIDAEVLYNTLPAYNKLFVTNSRSLTNARATFDALPISLSSSNCAKYLSFDVNFNNFKDDNISLGYGFTAYNGTSDMKITITPLTKTKFSNVVIKANFPVKNGSGISTEWVTEPFTINLSEDGSGTATKQIKYNSLAFSPQQPSFGGTIGYVSVSGTVSKR